MVKRPSPVTLIITAALTVGGLYLFRLTEPAHISFRSNLIIVLILILAIGGLIRGYKSIVEMRKHVPAGDEMTRKIEIQAGAYSYRSSMALWTILFFYRNSFDTSADLMGVGILGAATLNGIILIYLRKKGLPVDN
ncbi:MAG: hypothetical protein HQ508_08440 [Candidatus Marinimicrobia bacterium]|nr:hypothetical protein [Candidatus Neomarinimicrobiota bacterium]